MPNSEPRSPLSEQEVAAIVVRAEAAGLASAEVRSTLVAAIEPAVRARLSEHPRPADQLSSDLHALNTLEPRWLAAWLRAAERQVPAADRAWWADVRRRVRPDGPSPATVVRPALVEIPAGRFSRGSLPDEFGHFPDEAPLHRVVITRAVLMSCTPITRGQYQALLGLHPGDGPADSPVTAVRWRDAARYCDALSRHEGLAPVYGGPDSAPDLDADGYRLPTDAEWEYACRAGTETRFWSGDRDDDARRVGEFGDGEGHPGPVGARPANLWGLHDLHGGVWEWCLDGLAAYGPEEPQVDPLGPMAGLERVVRGGSLRESPRMARSACRATRSVGRKDDDMGFRIVRLA